MIFHIIIHSVLYQIDSDFVFLRNTNFLLFTLIVSFDLGKETYQKILAPDNGGVNVYNLLALSV